MAQALGPVIESRLIALLAGGATQEDVAQALGISRSTVERYAAQEQNRQVITEGRAALRRALVEKLAKPDGAVLRLLKRLEDNADTLLPKDADALARAIASLEKVASSASGEGRKGEQTGPRKVVLNISVPEWAVKQPEPIKQGELQVLDSGGRVVGVEAPPGPKKTDGAPTLRGELPGEDIDSRASGLELDADVSGTAEDGPSHPPAHGSRNLRGIADSDVKVPDDFDV